MRARNASSVVGLSMLYLILTEDRYAMEQQKPPNVTGWYWFRDHTSKDESVIVKVFDVAKLLYVGWRDGRTKRVGLMSKNEFEWARCR